jgi:hypothetical protein
MTRAFLCSLAKVEWPEEFSEISWFLSFLSHIFETIIETGHDLT